MPLISRGFDAEPSIAMGTCRDGAVFPRVPISEEMTMKRAMISLCAMLLLAAVGCSKTNDSADRAERSDQTTPTTPPSTTDDTGAGTPTDPGTTPPADETTPPPETTDESTPPATPPNQ